MGMGMGMVMVMVVMVLRHGYISLRTTVAIMHRATYLMQCKIHGCIDCQSVVFAIVIISNCDGH